MLSGPSTSELFGGALLVVGAAVLLFSLRYVWRAGRVFRSPSVTSLAGVAPGSFVRIAGVVENGDDGVLTAPFSGHESTVLRYAVEERRLSPMVLPWFVTIHERAGSVPFRLRTPAAAVDVVEPTHTVTLGEDRVATVDAGEDPPARIDRFEQHADSVPATTPWRDPPGPLRGIAGVLSFGTRRYTEQRASPGDEVTVAGRVTESGGLDPLVVSDRSRGATLCRMAGTSLLGFAIGAVAVAVGLLSLFVA
jgi:hypothetical protein